MSGVSTIVRGLALVILLPALTLAQAPATPQAQQLASHKRLAQRYLAEKKPELAIPELQAVVQLDPADIDSRANLGVLLFFGGKYAEAVPELRAAVAARPGLAKIQALLGISEKRSGDLQAAERDLATAFPSLEDSKIHLQAGLELVEADQALGMLDKAAAVISTLRTTDPTDPQVLSAAYQIYAQAMNESLLSLAVAAPDSAQLPFIMGQQLVQGGDSVTAIVQFRKALAIDPNLPGLHFVLAQALYSSSDPALHAQAEAEYHAALKLNPFDEKAWLGLAGIESDKGALEQASADYNKALALEPNDAEADTGLAKVLLAQNANAKAAALLEQAVKLDPTNITAHYRLSMLYRQEGRPEDAKQQLALYEHYKSLQSELQAAFQKMRTTPDTGADASASAHP
jgi:cytochrome c-type biogenesis protein CcmH/NrfG